MILVQAGCLRLPSSLLNSLLRHLLVIPNIHNTADKYYNMLIYEI